MADRNTITEIELTGRCPHCASTVSLVPGRKAERLFAFVCDDPSSPCRGSNLLVCCMEEHVESAVVAWNRRAAQKEASNG